MKIQQEFTLDRPHEMVWAFFNDVPAVALCLPGAEYRGQVEGGKHGGRISMKVGPFQASFEGQADVSYHPEAQRVSMSGSGVDKKGASRGKMTMECGIHGEGEKTRVSVDADVQLSGAIAQFGRTGIIKEIAGVLVSDFVRNVEAALPDPGTAETHPTDAPAAPVQTPDRSAPARAEVGAASTAPSGALSGTRLIWLSLKSMIQRVFGRAT